MDSDLLQLEFAWIKDMDLQFSVRNASTNSVILLFKEILIDHFEIWHNTSLH